MILKDFHIFHLNQKSEKSINIMPIIEMLPPGPFDGGVIKNLNCNVLPETVKNILIVANLIFIWVLRPVTHFEPSLSLCGAKTEEPREKKKT